MINSGDWLTTIGSPRVSAWPAASFTVASISTRAAPWLSGRPGKVSGQSQIETICARIVRLTRDGSSFELRDIHPQRLDGNIRAIHRFAEKVVGAHRPRHMIARTITMPRRRAVAGEIDRDFELRQHIAVHVDGNLGAVRPQVIGAKIDLVGQREFGGRDAEAVGLRGFLEHLIAARILQLKCQRTVGAGLVIRPVKRERPRVNRLARLVYRLLSGEQNGRRLFEPHRFGEVG